MFGRGLWTPDEPREADIAWRMSLQSDRTLPQLAGVPFLEKPPLSYWMSAAAVSLARRFARRRPCSESPLRTDHRARRRRAGASLQADGRAPPCSLHSSPERAHGIPRQHLAGAGCRPAGRLRARTARRVARLPRARAAGPRRAATPDARSERPSGSWPRARPAGWCRRWRCSRSSCGSGAGRSCAAGSCTRGSCCRRCIIGPWLLAVAHTAAGTETLRALFWHNVVGRFTRVAAPARTRLHDRASQRRGQVPVRAARLPAAVDAAGGGGAGAGLAAARARAAPRAAAWRFALAASLPFLVLLSLAATARDIYAAPALLGFGRADRPVGARSARRRPARSMRCAAPDALAGARLRLYCSPRRSRCSPPPARARAGLPGGGRRGPRSSAQSARCCSAAAPSGAGDLLAGCGVDLRRLRRRGVFDRARGAAGRRSLAGSAGARAAHPRRHARTSRSRSSIPTRPRSPCSTTDSTRVSPPW